VGKLIEDRTLHNGTTGSVNTVSECGPQKLNLPGKQQRPVADPKTNKPIPRNGGTTRVEPLTGSDADGSVVGFTIASLPAASQGTLYLGQDPAAVDAPLTVGQADLLSFEPKSGFTGEVVFTYTSVDDQGLVSLEANFVIPVANPLPVELAQFTVKARDSDAVLTWVTALEQDNHYFAVERSLDATRFRAVGTVKGQGTTATGARYSFVDPGVSTQGAGPVYYRLRQVDRDSTATYSAVRTVSFAQAAPVSFSVYPNPAVNELRVLLPTAGGRLTVYSVTGRLLLDARTDTINGALDVRSLPAGTYVLMVRSDQGAQMQHHFIKEKS
jgi:hypothetical protein